MKSRVNKAFSLIELSIVILIVGILVAGIYQATSLVGKSQLQSARNLTSSSGVNSIQNLAFWLDATRENSITNQGNSTNVSDQDLIKDWKSHNPQSTNILSATQSQSSDYPRYLEKGINNFPAIKFDGIDDYLSLPVVTGNLSTTSYTLFLVGQSDTTNSGGYFIGAISPVQAQRIYLQQTTGGFLSASFGPSAVSVTSSFIPTVPFVATMSYNAKTSMVYLYINNQLIEGKAGSYSGAPTSMMLSAQTANVQGYIDGKIGEYIYFDRFLTTEERDDVAKYLSKKWRIAIQ